jgi:cellulose synthase/poly-beta-1,6-N-acetylglucosamine synthase-like glycosyltransferase
VPVTVLVSTLDRATLLDRCLRALLAGTVHPEEIVVVDQSRDDATRLVIEALAEANRRPPLRWVRDPERGLAHSQNLGLSLARAPIVLVTDDDCVPAPDWVEQASRAFAEDPGLSLLGGRVLPLPRGQATGHAVATRPSTRLLDAGARTMPWDLGSGNNFALRRAALHGVRGNDERLGPGAEMLGGADMDLFRRVLRSGARGRYDPAVLVHHEMADLDERLARRLPYGYGMGACVSLWWRQGDRMAIRVLLAWVTMRLHRLLGGIRSRDSLRIREEVLILTGTARGLVHGARLPSSAPQHRA